MKKYAILFLFLFAMCSLAHSGMINVTSCDPRSGSAAVTLAGAGGKWVGFSARTSSGKIIDAPPIKKSKFGMVGSGSKIFRFGANKGVTAVRSSTWKRYNKKTNLMEVRVDDTGWVPCR